MAGLYCRVKTRVHEILENKLDNDRTGRFFNIFIVALICLNVVAFVLETVESLYIQYSQIFWWFEVISVAIFSIEYTLRIWACTDHEKYRNPVTGRIRYGLTPMAFIDLLAILPFYLPMFVGLDFRIVRMLRLFRLFRLFKLARYTDSLKTFSNIITGRKEDLTIALGFVIVMLFISSSLMYYAEHDAQPEKFGSIIDALWWGVITLATVGYGDVYPITPAGKLLGGIMALLGIGMFAIPAGIIGSGFVEEMSKKREGQKDQAICPHCGKNIHDPPLPEAGSYEPVIEEPPVPVPTIRRK